MDGDAINRVVERTVYVVDTTRPTALCKDAQVHVMLDASDQATITPGMIDDGSSDNCGPPSLAVLRWDALGPDPTVTCADLGNLVPVRLFASDSSFNWSIPGAPPGECDQ